MDGMPGRPRQKDTKTGLPDRSVRASYRSPIGVIEVAGTELGILSLDFVDGAKARVGQAAAVLAACLEQIDEYFRGRRKVFTLALDLRGTDFQKAVWRELLKVSFGKTTSYGAIARALGNGQAMRAVGGANRRNPVSIIVPCHRIVGADGSLTGYGGGLWRKEWLLAHERKQA
jgi:methylated-DNA-[protein]-cysteine S-methyltransferase